MLVKAPPDRGNLHSVVQLGGIHLYCRTSSKLQPRYMVKHAELLKSMVVKISPAENMQGDLLFIEIFKILFCCLRESPIFQLLKVQSPL